jgi:hypothetical protein
MEATKATEHSQDPRCQHTRLDDRYGKIGISAVAAAVRHQCERRHKHETRRPPYDSD